MNATRLSLLGALLLVGGPAAADPPVEGDRPACVTVRFQAFAAVEGGWNHLVWVRNGCDQPYRCSVTTTANPRPTEVSVAPGREEMVNTFLHSPAPGFQPRVSCAR